MKQIFLLLSMILYISCGSDHIIGVFNETGGKDIYDTGEENILPPDDAVGGYLKYSLTQTACPACFNESDEIDVRMQSLFHLPVSSSWLSYLPERGDCVSNLIETRPSVNQMSVGYKIDFNGGWSSGYMIEQGIISNGNFSYSSGYIAEANYNRDTWHDLYIEDYEILVENAFQSSHGFDYIEPYEMLWVDPSYAFAVTLFRSGMSFSWGPSGSDSDFLVMVVAYDPYSGNPIGNIACMGGDTGFMLIPEEYASKLPSGSLASIHLQRHKSGRFSFDRFSQYQHPTWIETHMFWEVIGTGHIE